MASWRLVSRDAEKIYNDPLAVGLIIMDKFDANRRRLLALGDAALSTAAILPAPASATLSAPRPHILTLDNPHTDELFKARLLDGRGYTQNGLARLNYFSHDYHMNKAKSIDPSLFDHFYRLQGLLGTNKPVRLISGYRSLDTNDKPHTRSRDAAKHSYHTKGQAIDPYIEGILLNNIRRVALPIRVGGVGYYPCSNFVYIDTGPVGHW